MQDYLFLSSFVIMLIAFALSYTLTAVAYRSGRGATILIGFIFLLMTAVFLLTGFATRLVVWQNICGLCAGVSFWIFFGEILGTLQTQFKVTTGVRIGYTNIPLLIVLGVLIWLVMAKTEIINNYTILQFINAVYFIWVFQVILLFFYHSPLLGGEIVPEGEKKPAIKVWSKGRITAVVLVAAIYILAVIPMIIYLTMTTGSAGVKIATGFWAVIILWSALLEIPKKLWSGRKP